MSAVFYKFKTMQNIIHKKLSNVVIEISEDVGI